MAEELKKAECDPTCGFMVRSHDEKEISEIVKLHAKKFHSMEVSDEELKEKIKAA
jgi:predicted small metal-binding protein